MVIAGLTLLMIYFLVFYLEFEAIALFTDKKDWLKPWWACAAANLGAALIYTGIYLYLPVGSFARIIIYHVLFFAFTVLTLGSSLGKRILYTAAILAVSGFVEFLYYLAWGTMFDAPGYSMELEGMLNNRFYLFYGAAIRGIIFFFGKRWIAKRDIGKPNDSHKLLYILVPLISMAGISICFMELLEYGRSTAFFSRGTLLAAGLLAISVIHVYLYHQQERLAREKQESMMAEKERQHRQENYEKMELYYEEIQMMRHDMKNQLLALQGSGGQSREQHLQLMIERLTDRGYRNFTKQPGVNYLINQKYNQAAELEISCNFDVRIPEELDIAIVDIASILGNTLDNAIEACELCPDPSDINLRIGYYKNYLLIKCDNSCPASGAGAAKKKDSGRHGYGLKSIKSAAERYNGDVCWEVHSGRFWIEISLWERG